MHEATALGMNGGILVHVELRSIFAAIAALIVGFAVGLLGTLAVGPANAELRDVLVRISMFGTAPPKSLDLREPFELQASGRSGLRVLASLETEVGSESAAGESDPSTAANQRHSFGERFMGEAMPLGSLPAEDAEPEGGANSVLLPPPDVRRRAMAGPAAGRSAMKLASLPPSNAAKSQLRPATASKDLSSLPDPDSRTAVYDIVAHTVYLPNGRRLEAHSGLGSQLDDPRYISSKGRGPTPPNVYDLTLREELFHGVRAIRLNPVDDGKMFGRDGMLAHTYMLGPNGQSNGCVSFSDYPAFLNAFLRGEIDRLVVVEHLANAPGPETASGWFPEAIKNLFGRS
jgi:Protein of unknown function (DUF2778)